MSIISILSWVLAASVRASLLVLVILLLQRLLRSRLSAKWKYALWTPVLPAILIPAQPLLPYWEWPIANESQTTSRVDTAPMVAAKSSPEIDLGSEQKSMPPDTNLAAVQPVASEGDIASLTPANPAAKAPAGGDAEIAFRKVGEAELSGSMASSQQTWDWWTILAAGWLLGAVCLGVVVWGSYASTLRRIRRRAISVDEVDLARVRSLANEIGLHGPPQVWLSPEVKAPAVCGLLRPMLLLNESFFQMLSREEADFVLRHELMHIRRRDILLNTMLFGMLSLHWFNPLLWYAFFRAGADREAACDEDVLHAESHARRVAYGKTLLRMEAELPQSGLCLGFVGMVQKGKRIRERIQFISNPKRMRLSVKSLALLCICVTAILGIAKSAEPQPKPQTKSKPQTLPSTLTKKERRSNEDEKTPQANATNAEIVSISTVGPRAEFQTDTDIVRYKGHFYIVFAKPTGERQNAIHILQSVDGRDWKLATKLRSEIEERRPDVTHSTHYSGRPVWFSTMPSGRLCVTGRASEKTIVWSTDNGADWREELDIKLSRSYSRVHWQDDRAYCVSDETSSCGEKFELFRLESAGEGSAPKTVYELSHNSHTLTGPRESQLAFAADQAFCMLSFKTYNFHKVRRWLIPSGKYATGRIGVSKAPYTEWAWTPTNLNFGHPNLLVLNDASIVSSVFVDGDEAHSALCQIDPSTGQLTELLRFPTGGIRQPVGMAEHDGHIWASFYDRPREEEKPVMLKVAKIKLANQSPTAFSQQPISKGEWTYKNGKPESVTFVYGTALTAKEIDQLSTCKSVTQVVMGYAGVNSEYVVIEGDLLKLGRLKNLKDVHLNKDGINDDDLKFVALLPKIHTLEFNADNGYDNAPICTDRCADHLSSAKTLRSLVIHDGQFTDKFVAKITEGLSNLEVLSLNSAELTDESLRLIADRCKKLKSLSIASDHFTVEGLKHLDKLKGLEVRAVSSPALSKRNDPKEILKLLGTWEYVSATYEGKPSEFGEDETITLTEDSWTLRRNGKLISRSTWEIDSTRSPKWLTQFTRGGKINFLDRWVYKFDGEQLVLCKSSWMDERRPKEFTSRKGDKQYLVILRRRDFGETD